MTRSTAKRKLTTIIAADVVGYSKMMAANEEATLKTLQTYRAVINELVEKHDGRVFSTAGDAFLAEFESAVEAVRCAISIQEDLAVRNAERPENQQMWFRIGVNVGDVMIDGEDLFGDGVNVAARLEGLAEKGGICISGSTFDQVKSKLTIAFDDIGAQSVKNIPEPIPAFRLIPGKVAVSEIIKKIDTSAPKDGRGRKVAFASFVLASALAFGLYLAGFISTGQISSHPYDGDWKANVDSLKGCFDNSPASFSFRIKDGKIEEQQQQFPKSGTVSSMGDFNIKVTDRSGNLRNTQIGKIDGEIGKGRFQGRRDGCVGDVRIVKLQ